MTNPNKEPQKFIGELVGGILIKKAVEIAVNKATDHLIKSPSVSVSERDKAAVKEVMTKEVLKEVGPVFENETNQEPLWRSKVLWTALGSLATSIGILGDLWTNGIPDAPSAYILAATGIVTSIGTIIARIFPTKAIGR